MAIRYIFLPIFLLLLLIPILPFCDGLPTFGRRVLHVQKDSIPTTRGFRNQAYNRGGKAYGKRFMDHWYPQRRETTQANLNWWNRIPYRKADYVNWMYL